MHVVHIYSILFLQSSDTIDEDDRDNPISQLQSISISSASHPGSEQTSAYSSHIHRSGIQHRSTSTQVSAGASTALMSGLNRVRRKKT